MERHEVTSGLLHTWRRNAMAGLLIDRPSKALAQPVAEPSASLAEVSIADPMATAPLMPFSSPSQFPTLSGQIAIELPSGIKLNVDASVDAEALGRVLSVLER